MKPESATQILSAQETKRAPTLYVFVGLYDGLIDDVTVCVDPASADAAFKKYTGHDYSKPEERTIPAPVARKPTVRLSK